MSEMPAQKIRRIQPSPEVEQWATQVIGAAIEVHRHLGPGLPEAVYENALCIELQERGIPFQQQVRVLLQYKGKPVGETRLDLLVAGCLVVELKAVDAIGLAHRAQVITYLRATHLQLGLIINFNEATVRDGIARVIVS